MSPPNISGSQTNSEREHRNLACCGRSSGQQSREGISAPDLQTKESHVESQRSTPAQLSGNQGDEGETKPVPADAKFVEFEAHLPKGPVDLRTAFYDDLLNERGAYYVCVQRV
jgi:hypothetical protein